MRPESTTLRNQVLAGALFIALCAGGAVTHAQGVDLASALLPPESDPSDCGAVVSHFWGPPSSYGVVADFTSLSLKCFQNVSREAVGNDELETYDAMLVTTVDFGSGAVAMTLTGPVQTLVTGRNLSTAGLFDQEVVSMSFSGSVKGTLIELRESPSLASVGEVDIADLGGGLYHIDSFFDVYTELSLDGGQSWTPVSSAQHLVLWGIGLPVQLQSFSVE